MSPTKGNMGELDTALRALVYAWREKAADAQNVASTLALNHCANELLSLLEVERPAVDMQHTFQPDSTREFCAICGGRSFAPEHKDDLPASPVPADTLPFPIPYGTPVRCALCGREDKFIGPCSMNVKRDGRWVSCGGHFIPIEYPYLITHDGHWRFQREPVSPELRLGL